MVLLPLAFLWGRLLESVWFEWSTNPQYSYGLVMPILIAGLVLMRWKMGGDTRDQRSEVGGQGAEGRNQRSERGGQEPIGWFWTGFGGVLAVGMILSYLPVRLLEAAVPEWRPLQWALAFIAIIVTAFMTQRATGYRQLRYYLFPLCFILVAVPWPTPLEQPVIQGLTRANAAAVIEILGLIGIAAQQHGNVIEISSGIVGIDEACSGIRSLQSSFMISLFFGEFYRLTIGRRFLLIPIGVLMAILLNIARTFFLTYVAAKEGTDAIAKYHDQAGVTIMLGCSVLLWCVAVWVHSRQEKQQKLKAAASSATDASASAGAASANSSPNLFSLPPAKSLIRLAYGLVVWLVLVEAGVYGWYYVRESKLEQAPSWTIAFPKDNPEYKDLEIPKATKDLLLSDEGRHAQWNEPDGTQWVGFYHYWHPGRVAGYLAKRHTPEVCLPGSGTKMTSGPELVIMDINGVALPVKQYVFSRGDQPIHVFHCRWEAGTPRSAYVAQDATRFNLVRSIWAGRGKHGQKVVELIVAGVEDKNQAAQRVKEALTRMVVVQKEKS